jgi:protoporphyrinogen oxidase/glycosyltransferase involved in cell wall biosynthesis
MKSEGTPRAASFPIGRNEARSAAAAVAVVQSFWIAGYEGADHVNAAGLGVDANAENGHLELARQDYAALAAFGIGTVRESVGWRIAAAGRSYSFDHLRSRAEAARALGLQIAWTMCHYGTPSGIDPWDRRLPARFARFCEAAARFLRPFQVGAPVFTPVNEISFLVWACTHEPRVMHADADGRAGPAALKRNLVAASLAGADAIRQVIPDARIMLTDPLINVVAPPGQPAVAAEAARVHAGQFESWDMHAGRAAPELGGHAGALDLIGVNYYHANQWEYPTLRTLMWHLHDPQRRAFSDLLLEVWHRYRRPLIVSETSHVGEGRGAWIREVAGEVALARARGADVRGVCIYPIVDRPAWEDAEHWHKSGLWDMRRQTGPGGARRPPARGLDMLYARDLRRAQAVLPGAVPASIESAKGTRMTALLVLSHLRWNFVFQRPQQLLVRLAARFPVLYVEEPVDADHARLEQICAAPNVRVLVPHIPGASGGFSSATMQPLQVMLGAFLEREGIDDYVAWLYTPMALDQLRTLKPRVVVYDCMDDLAGFRGAPAGLGAMEARLLQRADLVLTGGPSLFEARRGRHRNIHCFPSSVDSAHFAAAADPALEHPALHGLRRPRLGFFGVLDERLDAELIAALAQRHPGWEIVLVGPVAKIDPASLPRLPNISYFGQQAYADLPAFIAGWDVCLLPFALNEATRFISPTKTLEYMAAERPIVSTPVHDVIRLYGEAVLVGRSPDEFIAHCEQALAESPAQRDRRLAAARRLLAATSWDDTAERMHELVERELRRRPAPAARETRPGRGRAAGRTVRALVLGAGPTGLSAGYHLGSGSLIVEQADRVGGLCRSIEEGGFTFDHAGHIMFSNDPYVHELYRLLLGDNVHWQDREAWIYSHGVHTRYPFQGALHGLPPAVLKECILGAIEARYGRPEGAAPLRANGAPSATAGAALGVKPIVVQDCCADGSDPMPGRASGSRPARSRNFRDFIYETWGAGIARHFAVPYNEKLWACPLEEIETSWLEGRVPLPDLAEIIDGAVEPVAKPQGPNARFGYPLRGGFQALMDGFLPHLEGELRLNARVERVSPLRKLVTLGDGTVLGYHVLVSTMPLPQLIKAIGSEAPPEIRRAAGALRHVSLRCVNLGIGREALTEKHWIYYPGDSVFHRIFVQGNASPHCNPPGGFGLTCEITYSPAKPLPCEGRALIERCIADCIRVGKFTAADPVLVANMVDVPLAYVIYDQQRARNVALIRDWLRSHDIILAGRYSEWEYYNSDHAFLAGRRAAQEARARLAGLQRPVGPRGRPAGDEQRHVVQ